MPAPCRDCPERAVDFGGCRCQAFALTGDAAATDPACSLRARPRRDPARARRGGRARRAHSRTAAALPAVAELG